MGEVTQDRIDLIESYFAKYGWTFTRGTDAGTWNTGFRGKVANFNMFVRATDFWMLFVVNPFANGPKDPAMQARLHAHILRCNDEMYVAKFCLNKDNNVILTVDMAFRTIETFNYEEFEDGVNLICDNCDRYYLEILRLANEAGAPSRLLDPPPSGVDIT